MVREIEGAGLACKFEIIFVDDGSRDGTAAEVLRARSSAGCPVRLLRHGARRGQSAALWTGARAARGEWLATLDGDGQNDPADLPRLLQACRDGAASGVTLVAGHRVTRRDTWLRRASSRVANVVRNSLLGDHTPDTGCGIKVARRSRFLELPYFDHMHRFLPALFLRQGDGVISVPVNHRPRSHGRSKYGLFDRLWVGIADLVGVMWLKRRFPPPTAATEE